MRITPVTTAAGLFAACCVATATAAVLTVPWSADIPPLHRYTRVAVTEDDPGWNCLTMGNRRCGPAYRPIPDAVALSLRTTEGGDWTACEAEILADRVVTVVCSDGRVATS